MRKDILMMAALLACSKGTGFVSSFTDSRPSQKDLDDATQKCVVCKKPKFHNNAFCSADCCKAYKARKQA